LVIDMQMVRSLAPIFEMSPGYRAQAWFY